MLSPYLKRVLIDICLVAAFILGVYYFSSVFLDFLISLFHFKDMLNPSSGAYILFRGIVILTPLVMVAPNTQYSKYHILKGMFYGLGICFLLGNLWVIYFLVENSFSPEAFSTLWLGSAPVWASNSATEIAKQALIDFQTNKAFVFNYLVWDTYGLLGVLFSTALGVLYIRFAYLISGNPRKVCQRYLILTVLMVLIPFLYNLIMEFHFLFSDKWGERNILLICSQALVFLSLRLSYKSQTLWYQIFM